MKKGDKFEYTDIFTGLKETMTYTGTFREVKYVMYHFFTNEKGDTLFFTPTEVERMRKL